MWRQAHPEPLKAAFHNASSAHPVASVAARPLPGPSISPVFLSLSLAPFTLPQCSFLHLILLLLFGPAFIPPNLLSAPVPPLLDTHQKSPPRDPAVCLASSTVSLDFIFPFAAPVRQKCALIAVRTFQQLHLASALLHQPIRTQ
jgi:hypothetical protein